MKKSLLKPCCYCRDNSGCTTMNEALNFAKGAKITGSYVVGLNIKCSKYYEQWKPGDRVTFFYTCDQEHNEHDYVLGTVTGWKGRKIIIWLDKEINISGWRGESRKTQLVKCYPVHPFNETISVGLTSEKIKLCPGGWRPENYDCKKCPTFLDYKKCSIDSNGDPDFCKNCAVNPRAGTGCGAKP